MSRLHELLNYAFKKPGGPTEPSPPPKTVVLNASKAGTIPDKTKLSKVNSYEFSLKNWLRVTFFFKDVPPGIKELFQYIVNLEFKEAPDYHLMKSILADALNKCDSEYDGKFSFSPEKVSKLMYLSID